MMARNMKSEIAYARQLVAAGWVGARSVAPSRPVPAQTLCAAAAAGSAIGVFAAILRKRRGSSAVGISAMVGAAVGLCAGAVWETRSVVGDATRAAMGRINSTRDSHWVAKHPIAYG